MIYMCKQRSREWYNLRCGRITASNFHVMMGNSWTANSYILEKAMERITGRCVQHRWWNEDIQRGIDLEPVAIREYEIATGNKVNTVGFIAIDENIGSSPDGLVGTDGGIEIKCPNEKNFWKLKNNPRVCPQHLTQCQYNMWVSGRKWWDYVVYSTLETPIIIRIERDEEYVQRMAHRAEEVNVLIERYKNKIKNTLQEKTVKLRRATVMSGFSARFC